MRTVPAAILDGPTVGCWRVVRRDDVVLRSTELDADVVIETGDFAGTYASTVSFTGSAISGRDDLSTSSMETAGTLVPPGGFLIDGISAQDLEAGLLDSARATYFLVNWRDPQAGVLVQIDGTLGNIQRDSNGQWTCELRSLTHRYQQQIGRSFTLGCNVAVFGDARCGVDRDSYALSGTVLVSSGTRVFTADVPTASPVTPPARFTGGELRFLTGLNAGYSKEVKTFDGTSIECWEAFPFLIQAGDTFTLWPDCARDRESCKFFGNLPRFRGFPDFPGPDTLTNLRAGPTKKGRSGGGK